MSEQVGELYVSIQVDTEALEQGFTTAQRLGQDAAGTMERIFRKDATRGLLDFTDALEAATERLNGYSSVIGGNFSTAYTTSQLLAGGINSVSQAADNAQSSGGQAADTFATLTGYVGTAATGFTNLSKVMGSAGATAGSTAGNIATVGAAIGSTAAVALSGIGILISLATLFDQLLTTGEEAQNLIDYSQAYIDKTKEQSQAHAHLIALMEREAGASQYYISQIKTLNGLTDTDTEKKAKLAAAITQLNSMYPSLNLQIDKQTGHLTESSKAMLENIDVIRKAEEAEQARLMLAEKQQAYNDLVAEGARITQMMGEEGEKTKQIYNDARAKCGDFADAQRWLREENQENSLEYDELNEQLTKNQEAQAQASAELAKAKALYEEKQGAVLSYTATISEETAAELSSIQQKIEAGQALNEAESAQLETIQMKHDLGIQLAQEEQAVYEATTKVYIDAGQKRIAFDKEELAAMGRTQQEVQGILDERLAETQNIFGTIQEDMALTVDEMIANLEENQRAVADWSQNLSILAAKGIDDGLLETLQDAGPEAAGTVRNLVEASDEQLEKLNEVFANGSQEAINAMLQELGLPETVNAGSDTIDAVAEGVEENTAFVDASVEQIDAAQAAMEDAAEEADFSGIGERIANSLANGLTISMPKVTRAGKRVADALKDSMRVRGTVTATPAGDTASIQVNWYDKGGYFDQAAVIGIAEKRPEFVGAAEDLETFITRAVNEAMVKIPAAVTRAVPTLDPYAAGSGQIFYDNRVYLDVHPQQMTKEQTDYLIYKVNRELGKRLV